MDHDLRNAKHRSGQRQRCCHAFHHRAGATGSTGERFSIGALTKGSGGKELSEMGEMKARELLRSRMMVDSIQSSGMMRRAIEYARGFDLTVIDHCQDPTLSAGGVMHEGHWSLVLGLKGMPAAAEDVQVIRDCVLAQLTGARVHIAHVSTRGAIEAVRRAKEGGLAVTCEISPHHWTLTDESVVEYDTNSKMSPRSEVAITLKHDRRITRWNDRRYRDRSRAASCRRESLEFDRRLLELLDWKLRSVLPLNWSIKESSIYRDWWSYVRQIRRAFSV